MKKLFCIATLAALLTACGSNSDDDGLPETFANHVAAQNYSEAVAQTIGKNQWGDINPQSLVEFTAKLTQSANSMGAYKFHERVASEGIGERWRKVTYLIGFEREPLLVVFTLYKPADKWLVMDISYTKHFRIDNGQIITK